MKNLPTPPKKIETPEEAWRKGYELGVQTTMRQNDIAIRIEEDY